MDWNYLWLVLAGLGVGIAAAFTGLGGGFLLVPLLLLLGYTAQKAVGTSFLAILIISISALIAHNKLANVDYRVGLLLGLGGMVGAQIGRAWWITSRRPTSGASSPWCWWDWRGTCSSRSRAWRMPGGRLAGMQQAAPG